MRRIVRSLGGAIAFASIIAPAVTAQTSSVRFGGSEPTSDLSPSQRRFVDSLLPAIAGAELSRYTRLVHPASLACRNKDNEELFAEQFARRQGVVTTRRPTVTIQELPSQMAFFDYMAKHGYPSPVRPTHAVHLDLGPVGNKDRSVVAFVISDRGSWYEVFPCPTADAVRQFRARKAQEAEEQSKANELATSLRDPLRAEILALLNGGQKIGAIKKYQQATGVDVAMAKRVIEAIQSSTR